jgi:tetratricopeptide (TPR) repeat protein
MVDMSLSELINKCDAEIRAGRPGAAANLIRALTLSNIPREYRLPLATLCRRAGLTTFGLKLLTPVIRPDGGSWKEKPADAEISEYAVLLARHGSIGEALDLLSKIDTNASPETHLSRGFCHCLRWEYAEALPHFEAYLRSNPSAYQVLIARVNMASALVSLGRFEEALAAVNGNIEQAREGNSARLLANSLELRAQIQFNLSRMAECKRDLHEAGQVLAGETSDQLMLRKWKSVLAATETGDTKPLWEFRNEAQTRGHWESVREADFFLLKFAFNQEQFEHLVFGTPYQSYRDRVLKEFGRQPSSSYVLGGREAAFVMDLVSGSVSGTIGLSPGKKNHQLIDVLTRDFYRPTRLSSVFSELYPNEYFDIFSSPARVRMAVNRLRQWIGSSGLPLELRFDAGYILRPLPGMGLRIPFTRGTVDQQNVQWQRLSSAMPGSHEVSVSQIQGLLDVSASSALRLATWAVQAGHLERVGQGRSTRYRRVTHVKAAA